MTSRYSSLLFLSAFLAGAVGCGSGPSDTRGEPEPPLSGKIKIGLNSLDDKGYDKVLLSLHPHRKN